MKALENLHWSPRWVAHLGCIRSCLDYLGLEVSDPWLYGGCGHAFVMNVHTGVCPSGPTAWNTCMLPVLGRNVGYDLDAVVGFKHGEKPLADVQARAWAHVRSAIDRGLPCYAWELEIPEFYVIYGYEDGSSGAPPDYYYSGPGCEEGKGPKPWQELGDTGIGVVEVYSVAPGQPADDATTVREALAFAIEIAGSPDKWIFSDYKAGLGAYDNWIAALSEGKASDMGTRYNAGVWLECRTNAVGFLSEAKERLAGRADAAFDQAIAAYAQVAEHLGKVSEIYPWLGEASDEDLLPVDEASSRAVAALRTAKEAEGKGLRALEAIVQALA
ncbi:MAG: hypothetical protein JXA09_10375 [Anaerolineae bacterium]|nr:hypothetical protein [Anaerolineae bacterium]